MTEAPTPAKVPEADPPLDRAISPISGRLGSVRTGKAFALAGLLAGCAVFALATYGADRPRAKAPPERPARQVVAFEPAKAGPTLAEPGSDAPSLAAGASPYVPALQAQDQPSATSPGLRSEGPGAQKAELDPRTAPILAYSRGGDPGTPRSHPAQMIAAQGEGRPMSELDALRQGSRIGRVAARPIGDRNFLILAGATLPCVLQTAIDTTTAGYVTCLIGSDVYSDNGAVVLLEKGTRVLGEYRTGMRQGEARVFVLWIRAVTPAGVAIELASPASDALGRAGFGGQVDTHFWDRFGAAILLSVVDNGVDALAKEDPRGANARLPSDAAGLAVQHGATIAPTLRKRQGSDVAIQVAQDLDFTSVYGLRARP